MTNTSKVYNNTGDDLVLDDGSTITVAGTTYTATELKAVLALVAAIPVTDQEDSSTIWNDGGVLKVSTAG